jgi:hypothetical protein
LVAEESHHGTEKENRHPKGTGIYLEGQIQKAN